MERLESQISLYSRFLDMLEPTVDDEQKLVVQTIFQNKAEESSLVPRSTMDSDLSVSGR
jgi:hypothetical protein